MTRIVVLSGGLDSTSALALAVRVIGGEPVRAISFDYGQRHAKELEAAARIAEESSVPHKIIPLDLLHGSALLGEVEVPDGHYAEESMTQTVVNGRNLLFASVAIADANPGDTIWFGVHAGDHHIYPDCRPEFWDRLAALSADAYQVMLATPFLHATKGQALLMGARAGALYGLSWSCYKGGEVHCGRCGTCVERAEAFAEAGIEDPTVYADAEFWKTVTA